jgi:hypothetical protein
MLEPGVLEAELADADAGLCNEVLGPWSGGVLDASSGTAKPQLWLTHTSKYMAMQRLMQIAQLQGEQPQADRSFRRRNSCFRNASSYHTVNRSTERAWQNSLSNSFEPERHKKSLITFVE